MRVCAPVVGSEQITAMFQNHLHDDKSLHYGEFINDLTKYLVRSTRSNISVAECHAHYKAYTLFTVTILTRNGQHIQAQFIKLLSFKFHLV